MKQKKERDYFEKVNQIQVPYRIAPRRPGDIATCYADPSVYYSDDWTPGLEELRLLIYGEDGCVEDYAWSQRFVCFLNASGEPYRNAAADPVTLDEDTMDEPLLRIHREADSLFVIIPGTFSTRTYPGL